MKLLIAVNMALIIAQSSYTPLNANHHLLLGTIIPLACSLCKKIHPLIFFVYFTVYIVHAEAD